MESARRKEEGQQRWKCQRFSGSTFYTSVIFWELGLLQFTFYEEGTYTAVNICLYYSYTIK